MNPVSAYYMQGMVLSAGFPGISTVDEKTALTPFTFWRKERDDREETMVTLMCEGENSVLWDRERRGRGATLHSSDGESLEKGANGSSPG